MKKLLDEPFKAFTLFSLIVLIASTPVYYFVVDFIWLEGLDDHNELIKIRVQKSFDKAGHNEESITKTLEMWKVIEPGIQISKATKQPGNDQITSRYRVDKGDDGEVDEDRFRCLSTQIQINGQPYQLVVETNVEEADETLLAIALVTILFFIVLVAGFIILNRRISKKSWLPFRHTLSQLQQFDLNQQQTIDLEATDIQEFYLLNTELTRLIDRNLAAFSHQKRFIENASHELQTPLSVLKTKTDRLLQHKNLTIEQSETIHSIHQQLSKVTHINRNLLLLAKIENHQYEESETIVLNKLLQESLKLLTDFIQSKGLLVKAVLGNPHVEVKANRTLLEIVINNLLMNAIVHNPAHGTIDIKLENEALSISNSGTSALDPAVVFDRFSTTTNPETGSGLGLALVKEIANRYGWEVVYLFEEEKHFFIVQF